MNQRKQIKTMGQRLRAFRKSKNLKGYQFAKKIGISQGSLSDLENEISLPSAKTLKGLCLETDINIHWLLTGKGKMTR